MGDGREEIGSVMKYRLKVAFIYHALYLTVLKNEGSVV